MRRKLREFFGEHGKKLSFSSEASSELLVLTNAIDEILSITTSAYEDNDLDTAAKVEPLEQVIDGLTSDIKTKHIERLQHGECTIEMGFILSDILNNYERVSDHCSNIALTIIELIQENVEAHEYMLNVKSSPDDDFIRRFENYKKKYNLN